VRSETGYVDDLAGRAVRSEIARLRQELDVDIILAWVLADAGARRAAAALLDQRRRALCRSERRIQRAIGPSTRQRG
jgi:hypothetical protein